jgi:hypothetical protein
MIGQPRTSASRQPGDTARRVNERIGGREQLAHPIGEAEHPNPRLVGERLGQLRPQPLVSPGETDDDRRPRLQGSPHRSA